MLDRGLRAVERGLEIGRDHGIPIRFGHHHDQCIFGDAGIIDENAQVTEGFDRKFDQRVGLFEIRYIRLKGSCFSAGFLDLLDHLIGGFGRFMVIDHHRCSTGSQLQSDRTTDAARSTGNEGDPVFKR